VLSTLKTILPRISRTAITVIALALAMEAYAQSSGESAAAENGNRYRAEILVMERLIDPAEMTESLAGRVPDPLPTMTRQLWVEDGGGRTSSFNLLPQSSLYLSNAAGRLNRSGRYRTLMLAGWTQSFAPGADTGPMAVALGKWLDGIEKQEIEGFIRIERQRYLHVTANLNHWTEETSAQAQPEDIETTPTAESATGAEPSGTSQPETSGSAMPTTARPAPLSTEPVLLDWVRETRRMRSEELHFLDSPTLGVLIYFKPLD